MRKSKYEHLKALTFLVVKLATLSFAFQLNASTPNTLTIGFGSCSDQKRQQPIWGSIASHQPELFILMGDNVYIDTDDPKKMEVAYKAFKSEPHFKKFSQTTPLIATWDDHDYGKGDAGKEFIGKKASREAFLSFFDYPELKSVRNRKNGLYHTKWLTFNGKKIQIIMLDTRWYRDPLIKSYLTKEQRLRVNLGPYQPNLDKTTTLLGDEQWLWLAKQIKQPADLRVLVSSIQVLTEFSGWETWANFPHQRKKLLDMLQANNNGNTIILSGDIHRAEIAQIQYQGKKLTEVTSSGLAVKTYPEAVNKHRIDHAFENLNYGMLEIIDDGKLFLNASIYDQHGVRQRTVKVGAK